MDSAWRHLPKARSSTFPWHSASLTSSISTCPCVGRCCTILVRNRDRELYCVACQLFVRAAPPSAAHAAEEEEVQEVPAEPTAHRSFQQQQPPPQQAHTQQAQRVGDAALAERQEGVKRQLCHTLLDKAAQINERLASAVSMPCNDLLHSLMTVCDAYAKVQSCL